MTDEKQPIPSEAKDSATILNDYALRSSSNKRILGALEAKRFTVQVNEDLLSPNASKDQ
jgi:hypothetical protein